ETARDWRRPGYNRRNGEEFAVPCNPQVAAGTGRAAMSATRRMNCDEVAPLLVFLACDEVTADERSGIENHIAECAECRAQLAEFGQFQESLAAMTQAADELDRTGTLLAQCRSEL